MKDWFKEELTDEEMIDELEWRGLMEMTEEEFEEYIRKCSE